MEYPSIYNEAFESSKRADTGMMILELSLNITSINSKTENNRNKWKRHYLHYVEKISGEKILKQIKIYKSIDRRSIRWTKVNYQSFEKEEVNYICLRNEENNDSFSKNK